MALNAESFQRAMDAQAAEQSHIAAAKLATHLLVAEAAAGRWTTSDPGSEVEVRARMAYRTAQVFLAALDELRPEGLRP